MPSKECVYKFLKFHRYTGFFVGSLDESDYFKVMLMIKIQQTNRLEVMGKLSIVEKTSIEEVSKLFSNPAVYLIWALEAPYHH
jgi:hypothetical protein